MKFIEIIEKASATNFCINNSLSYLVNIFQTSHTVTFTISLHESKCGNSLRKTHLAIFACFGKDITILLV